MVLRWLTLYTVAQDAPVAGKKWVEKEGFYITFKEQRFKDIQPQ